MFFGVLDLVALLVAFGISVHVLDIYFSYFTVLSNILITFVFLYLSSMPQKKAMKHPLIRILYGPAVLYMMITGIVFWTILRHHHLQVTSSYQWINLTMHGLMPIAAVVSWTLFAKGLQLRNTDALWWLVFPLLYVFYTLIRGPFAHWYPYPFLNPAVVGGYAGVAAWVIGILCGTWIVGTGLVWISKKVR